MAEVIILRPGFVLEEHVGTEVMVHAGCTISLIRAQENILVDSGGPSESALLLALLAAQSLRPQQIQYVIYTHGHIDHVGNSNLFPQATFIAGRDRAIGDRYAQLDYSTGPLRLADDVHIIPAPGHTSEDISVLVTTATGLVAMAMCSSMPVTTITSRGQSRAESSLATVECSALTVETLLETKLNSSRRNPPVHVSSSSEPARLM
jgi:metal-dependent hydrolase (beta-lactamase superfamily II)